MEVEQWEKQAKQEEERKLWTSVLFSPLLGHTSESSQKFHLQFRTKTVVFKTVTTYLPGSW